jgi:hypothetical protein
MGSVEPQVNDRIKNSRNVKEGQPLNLSRKRSAQMWQSDGFRFKVMGSTRSRYHRASGYAIPAHPHSESRKHDMYSGCEISYLYGCRI